MDALSPLDAIRATQSITRTTSQSSDVRETSEKFETLLLNQMYEEMFRNVKVSSLTGGGFAEEMWRSFMLSEYAEHTVQNGSIGIADAVEKLLTVEQSEPDE